MLKITRSLDFAMIAEPNPAAIVPMLNTDLYSDLEGEEASKFMHVVLPSHHTNRNPSLTHIVLHYYVAITYRW